MRTASRRNGFVNSEMPIAMAIVLILAAILFPIFSQARAKARQTYCLCNEKQIGMALRVYMQDSTSTSKVVTLGSAVKGE